MKHALAVHDGIGYPKLDSISGIRTVVVHRAGRPYRYGDLQPHRSMLSAKSADEDADLSSTGWPWIFQERGRAAELPKEKSFAGFGGLSELFDGKFDTLNPGANGKDGSEHDHVSREVRSACHTPVSLDPAPTPTLVVLSRVGAGITGLPYGALPRARSAGGSGECSRPRGQHEKQLSDDETKMKSLATPPHRSSIDVERELDELALALTGTVPIRGSQPFASCYGGHQFGNWAGQLGDGRVATLGDIRSTVRRDTKTGAPALWSEELIEVQLKGIGKTPFSRGGDGKAVLGACLREYLFSEACAGLGLPTVVTVSVCTTGEAAMIRDPDPTNSASFIRAPGAILCRVAPSFLRFGSFELPARRGEVEIVRHLADYSLRHLSRHLMGVSSPSITPESVPGAVRLDTDLSNRQPVGEMGGTRCAEGEPSNLNEGRPGEGSETSPEDYLELLIAIVTATARMVAGWQALGFCHGVLNTDNFTLLGLAIDFGPCSFMEGYIPSFMTNEGDSARRYTFQNQPDISAWNCERLADAFSCLIGQSGVAEANAAFSPAFDAAYTTHLHRKLGLEGMDLGSGWVCAFPGSPDVATYTGLTKTSSDRAFVMELFRLMADCGTDFTETWRALVEIPAMSVASQGKDGPSLRTRSGAEVHSRADAISTVEAGEAGMRILDAGRADRGQQCQSGGSGDNRWSDETSGMDISDEECLQPLSAVLTAAAVSREKRKQWATWTRQFMARIDYQGVGVFHPQGKDMGRQERLEVMRSSSPTFILRESAVGQALKAALDGDMSYVHQLEKCLAKPYSN